jgi:hypothetical protein
MGFARGAIARILIVLDSLVGNVLVGNVLVGNVLVGDVLVGARASSRLLGHRRALGFFCFTVGHFPSL